MRATALAGAVVSSLMSEVGNLGEAELTSGLGSQLPRELYRRGSYRAAAEAMEGARRWLSRPRDKLLLLHARTMSALHGGDEGGLGPDSRWSEATTTIRQCKELVGGAGAWSELDGRPESLGF